MTMELIEDAYNDPQNAQFLAMASDLAYLGENEGSAAFKEKLGLDAHLISVGNTQVFVGSNDDHVVTAFRGTESPTSIEGLKDWLLTDAVNMLIVPEGRLGTDFAAAGVGARFHKGFMTALAAIWDPMFARVDEALKKKERPLWITGHSLGGALAVLAGWRFLRTFTPVHQIYTFGGPMVGNAEASQAIDKALPGKIFRYVNAIDPIPRLPTVSLIANDYGHCQLEIALGEAASDLGGSAAEMFKTLGSRAVEGVLHASIFNDLWSAVLKRVAAHGLDNYRDLIVTLLAAKVKK
jgi:predicted lipase